MIFHHTIVLVLSIKPTLLTRKNLKAADQPENFNLNQSIAGPVLIRSRHTAALSTPPATSVAAVTGHSLGPNRGPESQKSFTLPLRTNAIWTGRQKTRRPSTLCRSLPVKQHCKTSVFCVFLFFQGLFVNLDQIQVLASPILPANRVIYSEQTKTLQR